jgi:hypothetical protein
VLAGFRVYIAKDVCDYSRTKAGNSKTSNNSPSLNHKRCRLGIRGCFFDDPASTL